MDKHQNIENEKDIGQPEVDLRQAETGSADIDGSLKQGEPFRLAEESIGTYTNRQGTVFLLAEVTAPTPQQIFEMEELFMTSFSVAYVRDQVIAYEDVEKFIEEHGRVEELSPTVEKYIATYFEYCRKKGLEPFGQAGFDPNEIAASSKKLHDTFEFLLRAFGNYYVDGKPYGSFAEELELFNQHKAEQDFRKKNAIIWLVAREEDNPEKLAGLIMFDYRDAPKEVYCRQFAVDPDYWASGISMGLMVNIAVIGAAKGMDIQEDTEIVLATRWRNVEAVRFYRSAMGFEPDSDESVMQHGLNPVKYCSLRRGLLKPESDRPRIVEGFRNTKLRLGH